MSNNYSLLNVQRNFERALDWANYPEEDRPKFQIVFHSEEQKERYKSLFIQQQVVTFSHICYRKPHPDTLVVKDRRKQPEQPKRRFSDVCKMRK